MKKIFLLWCFLFGLVFSAWLAADADPAKKQKELKVIQVNIEKLKKTQQKTQQALQKSQQALRRIEKKIGQLARRLNQLQNEVKQQNQALQALEKQQVKFNADLAQQREALAEQMRTAYSMGRQEQLKLLLNQQDPAKVSRMLVYYECKSSACSTN